MFFLFGFGKTTKKVVGANQERTCIRCNTQTVWQLCIIRTWFTLFFIPVIPYAAKYCICCPNCDSYIELSKEEFEKYKGIILQGSNSKTLSDAMKYKGKNAEQINYLKQMEETDNHTKTS